MSGKENLEGIANCTEKSQTVKILEGNSGIYFDNLRVRKSFRNKAQNPGAIKGKMDKAIKKD